MNYIIKNKQLPNICSFVAFVKEKQRIKRFEGAGAGLKRDCFVIWRPVDVNSNQTTKIIENLKKKVVKLC